jgi:mannose-6-phosphate isomerase-like protein (cupin superfamily)
MTLLPDNVVIGSTVEANAGAGYAVVRGPELALRPAEADRGLRLDGLQAVTLLSRDHGSVHMEIAVSELAPGGVIAGHLHPFEESFYLLSGRALLAVGGERYALRTDDFGFVPVAVAHAWHNPYDEPARWLRVRVPQPRRIGDAAGTYASRLVEIPKDGRTADEADPTVHFVGHFSDADLNAPGPLSMPGYHGHNIRDISVRMMVDDVLGAVHHTLFTVEFAPRTDPGATAQAKEHFHPFEEIYFLVAGQAQATLAGDRHDVAAGDLVWAGTNTSHGYVNTGDVPVRWLEVQAPAPPPSNAFFFDDDWRALEERRR